MVTPVRAFDDLNPAARALLACACGFYCDPAPGGLEAMLVDDDVCVCIDYCVETLSQEGSLSPKLLGIPIERPEQLAYLPHLWHFEFDLPTPALVAAGRMERAAFVSCGEAGSALLVYSFRPMTDGCAEADFVATALLSSTSLGDLAQHALGLAEQIRDDQGDALHAFDEALRALRRDLLARVAIESLAAQRRPEDRGRLSPRL